MMVISSKLFWKLESSLPSILQAVEALHLSLLPEHLHSAI